MKVLSWEDFCDSYEAKLPMSATIGVFDGLHRGHRLLIERVLAHRKAGVAAVFTFTENPKAVLHPESYAGDLASLGQRLEAFEALGLDLVVLIDFSGNFSKLAGRDFLSVLYSKGRLEYIAVGSNFSCGHGLDVDACSLKSFYAALDIEAEVVEPVMQGSSPVSSSRIRRAIVEARFREAAAMLGRDYEMDFRDIRFEARASELRFERPRGLVLPPVGIYEALALNAKVPALFRVEPDSLSLVAIDGRPLGQVSFIKLTKD
jgi:riboflavin kinase / FMN adenylyltransferase